MVSSCWLAGLLCLALPNAPDASRATSARGAETTPGLQLAQAGGIKGQDPETAGRGEGATGWVQAPVPRGQNASDQQAAQGAGARPANGAGSSGKTGNGMKEMPAGQDPGAPIATPLPGPSGVAPPGPAK